MNTESHSQRASSWFLLAGALVGLALAASGLFNVVESPPADDEIASVNGWAIQRSDFERFIDALQRDKKSPLSEQDRRNILDRMIEEKLILQRGLELGLVEDDSAVRKAISNAMIQTITAEVSAIEPEDTDLKQFFSENQSYFAQPARLRVQQLVFLDKGDSGQALGRAEKAHQALVEGKSIIQVQREFADQAVLSVPNTLLPQHKLRDYIGPKLLELASQMQAGAVSKPQPRENSYVVLIVFQNEPQANVALASIRERVVAEYQRRAGEQALRDYLEMLRSEADIRLSTDLQDDN
ncbi:MAG: peptidylprolyl isomerase [Pseudomonadales bacterium]